jgi:uncharacterized small protein (DUF1192 family)
MTEREVLFQISNIVNGPLSFSQVVEQIALLLDSFDQPHRSLYSDDLRTSPLADFVGEQLGMLLARTRLAERRAHLKHEIEKIKEDLATRKAMQRAEGILIAKRGMAAVAARRWIAQQSHKTGLSKRDVAERIIAYHQAKELEQRIA